MTNTKITKRTVLNALINADFSNIEFDGVTVTDVINYAENEITLLDRKSAKAKSTSNAKKAQELAELKAQILEVVGTEPLSLTEIADAIGIYTQKATKPVKALVESGELVMTTEKRKNYYALA